MSCVEVGLTPACVDVRVHRGTDVTLTFILTDASGHAIDITSDDVVLTVKDTFDGTTMFQDTSAAGFHLDPTGGKVEYTIPKESIDDEALTLGETNWVYEVRRLVGGAGGDEIVHIQGDFVIAPSVGM